MAKTEDTGYLSTSNKLYMSIITVNAKSKATRCVAGALRRHSATLLITAAASTELYPLSLTFYIKTTLTDMI